MSTIRVLAVYTHATFPLKVKQSYYRPGQALRVPESGDSQISRPSAHEGGKVASLKHRSLYPHEIFLVLISVKNLSRPQGHSAAGRIMSMKNYSGTIGIRTRDLPTCTPLPRQTVQPRAHTFPIRVHKY